MKPLLIVNPRAGGGRTGEAFGAMVQPIERALGSVDVAYTERARHATELARDAALAGRETVIAVGGDGSVHEVVCGLMLAQTEGARGTKLGIIGQGTGGDLQRTLGLEHRLDRYCAVIAEGATRRIDIGRFTYEDHDGHEAQSFFVNILSVGIGGLVDRYVAETSKALGGKAAYFAASLKGLIRSAIGVLACTIDGDGESRDEVIPTRSLAICNGRYFGSGMHIAPMAQPDDGLFDIVDLGSAPRLRFAAVSSKVYSGAHIHHPEVHHFRASRIRIRLVNEDVGDRFLLDVDGEPLGRLPIDVAIVPKALHVFAPARGSAPRDDA